MVQMWVRWNYSCIPTSRETGREAGKRARSEHERPRETTKNSRDHEQLVRPRKTVRHRQITHNHPSDPSITHNHPTDPSIHPQSPTIIPQSLNSSIMFHRHPSSAHSQILHRNHRNPPHHPNKNLQCFMWPPNPTESHLTKINPDLGQNKPACLGLPST